MLGHCQDFQKPSEKKDKLLKIVITLKEKAVKSKALKVNRKVLKITPHALHLTLYAYESDRPV